MFFGIIFMAKSFQKNNEGYLAFRGISGFENYFILFVISSVRLAVKGKADALAVE